jgi:hypothetical protein
MSVIKINMDKAREIWRGFVLSESTAKLDEIRSIIEKYADEGKDTSALIEKRKKIRSLVNHPDIDAAKTPEELKAFWPAELKEATKG